MGFKTFDPKTAKPVPLSLFPRETTDLSNVDIKGWFWDKLRECYASGTVKMMSYASILNAAATSGMPIFSITRTKNGLTQLLINDANIPWAKDRSPDDETGSILSGQEYISVIELLEGVAQKIVEESKKGGKQKSASVWKIKDADIIEFLEQQFGSEFLNRQVARFSQSYEDSDGRKVLFKNDIVTKTTPQIKEDAAKETTAIVQTEAPLKPQNPPVPPALPVEIVVIPMLNNQAEEPNFSEHLIGFAHEILKEINRVAGSTDDAVVVALGIFEKGVEYGILRNNGDLACVLECIRTSTNSYRELSHVDLAERKVAVALALSDRFHEFVVSGAEVKILKPYQLICRETGHCKIVGIVVKEAQEKRWADPDQDLATAEHYIPSAEVQLALQKHAEWTQKLEALESNPDFAIAAEHLDDASKLDLIKSIIGEEPVVQYNVERICLPDFK